MTLRGLLILLGSVYLVALPGRTSADLVAKTIGLAGLVILVILLLITLIATVVLRRRLSLSLHAPDENLVSQKPILFLIKTSKLSLPPLFSLDIKLKFKGADLPTHTHVIEGFRSAEHKLSERITFPHRGYWSVESADATFGDLFGLTGMKWKVRGDALLRSLRVSPPTVDPKILPILSSSERSGDLLPTHHNRSGDAFDLKSYHPSDGMRRIAWKIYARSGELVSRHPEPSMTPEGTVVVFAMLDREHDRTAASTFSYLKQLEELDLDIFFGCQGFSVREKSEGGPSIAATTEEAEEMLIETAFAPRRTGSELEDIRELLKEVQKLKQLTLTRVLIFLPPAKCAREADLNSILSLARILEESRIKPVFIIQGEGDEIRRLPTQPTQTLRSKIASFFFERPALSQGDFAIYKKFITVCAGSNWQVIV